MENNTEKQILDELKTMNRSLQVLIDKADHEQDEKPSFILWDMLKSLLIGLFIVGPGIAVAFGIFAVIFAKFS